MATWCILLILHHKVPNKPPSTSMLLDAIRAVATHMQGIGNFCAASLHFHVFEKVHILSHGQRFWELTPLSCPVGHLFRLHRPFTQQPVRQSEVAPEVLRPRPRGLRKPGAPLGSGRVEPDPNCEAPADSTRLTWKLPGRTWNQVFQKGLGSFHVGLGEIKPSNRRHMWRVIRKGHDQIL